MRLKILLVDADHLYDVAMPYPIKMWNI